jgi:hypothetical protein
MVIRLAALTLPLSLTISCYGADGDDPKGAAGSGAGGMQNVYTDQIRSDDGCLPRQLLVDDAQQVPCSIIEATVASPCSCDALGRLAVSSNSVRQAILQNLEQNSICGATSGVDCAQFCLCEIYQPTGSELLSCQNDVDSGEVVGVCYIDEDQMIGNPELVADCPETQRRRLRFVDPSGNTPQTGASLFIACVGASL